MASTETALIVPVPEVEEAVGPFRASLDRAARWAVPAHVTVLYPFLPPERIDDQVLAVLHQLVAAVPRWTVTFTHVAWFDDSVIWLAPRPDEPFRALTAAVWRRFPETPPYGGAHAEVVPHLTIGDDAPAGVLARAAEVVSARLPIRATVDVVRLIAGRPEPDSWRTVHRFPLGTAG